MILSFKDFTGLVPRFTPETLPDNAAQLAVDCDFTRGDLRGLPAGSVAGPAMEGVGYAFTDGVIAAVAADKRISAVKAPTLEDAFKRYYFSNAFGDIGVIQQQDLPPNLLSEPSNAFKVGVPRPTVPLEVEAVESMRRELTSDIEWQFFLLYEAADGSILRTLRVDNPAGGAGEGGSGVLGRVENERLAFDVKVPIYAPDDSGSGTLFSVNAIEFYLGNYVLRPPSGVVQLAVKSMGEVVATWSGGEALVFDGGQAVSLDQPIVSPHAFNPADDTSIGFLDADSKAAYNLYEYLAGKMQEYAKPVMRVVGYNTATKTEDFVCFSPNSARVSDNRISMIPGGVSMDWQRLQAWMEPGFAKWRVSFRFGPVEARNYVYTFVNKFGEESAPSPPMPAPVALDFFQDAKLKLTYSADDLAPHHGFVDIYHVRVYRTMTGESDTEFMLVFSTEYVNGDVEGGERTTGDQVAFVAGHTYEWLDRRSVEHDGKTYFRKTNPLYTLQPLATWLPPPKPLWGLVSLSGGVLAAFNNNSVFFSEPYRPYAWPPEYELTFKVPVVGLVPMGSGCLILTRAEPYYIAGEHPSTYLPHMIPAVQGALSRYAATSIGGGAVAYASADGIVLCDGAQASLRESQTFMSRATWQELVNAGDDLQFAFLDGWLIVIRRNVAGGGYAFKLDDSVRPTMTSFSPAFSFLGRADVILSQPGMVGDALYGFSGTSCINVFDYSSGQRRAFQWRSKEFVLPSPTNFGVLQIFGSGTVAIKIFADGVERFYNNAVTLNNTGATLLRLPAGFRATRWSLRIDGAANAVVTAAYLATSIKELRDA